MNTNRLWIPAYLAIVVSCCVARTAQANHYVAYSLTEAERRVKAGQSQDAAVAGLGAITHPMAVVYDELRRDLIVVGRSDPAANEPPVTLDEFVVALRAILNHETWPLVSIDKDEQTQRTRQQTVRFDGGIEGTSFGKAMLDADVLLKKLGLGEVSAEIWEVRSLFDLLCDHVRKSGSMPEIRSRVWFVPDERYTSLAEREGVMVIEDLAIRVETRFAATSNQGGDDKTGSQLDAISRQFADSLSASFPALRQAHLELARLDALFKLVALADGIRILSEKYESFRPDLSFWQNQYDVASVQTSTTYPLCVREGRIGSASETGPLELDGGVELRALMLELNDGSITALRDIVTKSRPDGSPLTWNVPLEAWNAPGTEPLSAARPRASAAGRAATYGDLGCTFDGRLLQAGGSRKAVSSLGAILSAVELIGLPEFRSRSQLASFSPNIGGVMLSGAAAVEGTVDAQVDVAGGNFSLIVDGKNARIDPKMYRKFITALWCVYYGDQDPGISIDPPWDDSEEEQDPEKWKADEKHSVRYIGRVLNTDLGRVMREADYLMKKWSVGTEPSNYPGLFSVSRYAADLGGEGSGIPTRFWFVPKDLRFKRGGELLLFDGGRMQVNTEFDRDGMRGKAGPAAEKFADFFTQHYQGIAAKHPIFRELFEYAKLVSLAKYLKQQGVPLHWFLMANKDLVLMEDSPLEVDGLLNRSEYVRGYGTYTSIAKGGVDLAATPTYRYDPEAVAAVKNMMAQIPAVAMHTTGLSGEVRELRCVPAGFSFDLGRQSYSVVPQHTLTSGKDHRGIRYQTDLAMRQSGRPGLELVRYFNPRNREGGEFGKGWHLLIPYRIQPAGDDKQEFLNVVIPKRMALENLCTGQRETLTFREGGDEGAGYVPKEPSSSQVVRLALMSDASYRLIDKLGNQFQFDQGGHLTDMLFSPNPDHYMHVEYLADFTDAFDRKPYVVRPLDKQRVVFRNMRVPKRVKVTDLLHGHSEVLTFSTKNRVVGYVPQNEKTSRFQLAALLSNTGLQLADNHGNEMVFDPNWRFETMLPSPERRMVRSVSMGRQKTTFGYTINGEGEVIIASASLAENRPGAHPTHAVHYEHDREGRLSRVRRSGPGGSPAPPAPEHDLAMTGG